MQIKIKNKKVLLSLLSNQYDPNLIHILEDFLDIVDEAVITEAWRSGSGVHSVLPCRGIILRSWMYTADELNEIAETINALWTYDPGRLDLRCLVVVSDGKGYYIHIQSHPQTIKKGD